MTCISHPQQIQKIIEKQFEEHFNKSNVNLLEKFSTPPKKLDKRIATEEVISAVKMMANNKAPGKDNINIELIKYAPKKLQKEISDILNSIFESNINEIKLGTGILLPIPKRN